MDRSRTLIAAVVLVACGSAEADDQADVRDAARNFLAAMIVGDQKAIDALYATEAKSAREMADPICTMYAARRRLYAAGTKRFGADEVAHAPELIDPKGTVESIAQADVTFSEDTAAVKFGQGQRAHLGLIKQGGRWKVCDLSGTAAPRRDALAFYPRMTAALDATTKDVDAGGYGSMKEAVDAVQRRVRVAATRPTS